MMTEIPRKDFLQMLKDGVPWVGSRLAVCLFILPEWLKELRHLDSNTERITNVSNYGREIFSALDSGYFTRIAWSTYCAVTPETELSATEKLNGAIERLQLTESYCRLWRYAVRESTGQNLYDVFYELEGLAYDNARLE